MGAWDKGNFDNDSALDMLDYLMEWLVKDISFYFAPERRQWLKGGGGERAMAAIDMLLALNEHCDHLLFYIYPRLVRHWRDIYLRGYDETGGWHSRNKLPSPEFIAERRRIIADTFDRLEAAARNDEDDGVALP